MVAKQGFLFDGGGSDLCFFIGFDVRVCSDADKGRAVQLAMIEALLRSRDGKATVDAIVRDLTRPFPDGGKWVGTAIKELSDASLIRCVGATNSKRKPRHGGLSHVWEIADRKAAKLKLKRLRSALSLTANDKAGATAKS